MKPKTIVISILFLLALVFFIVRFWSQPRKYEYTFYPMGGIPFKIVAYDVTDEQFGKVVQEVRAKVANLTNIFDIHKKISEVSMLNGSENEGWHSVSKNLYECLESSLKWYGKTGGAFDVTVFPLVQLWKTASKEGNIPTEKEIGKTLKKVGSSKITLSKSKGVEFAARDMKLDFGGIAKGFILDRAGAFLESLGVGKYVISCGGDVLMNGKESFSVGIQEPGGEKSKLMMIMNISDNAVVTSGHYERHYDINGKKYSHIINPKSGWPVDNELASITIIGSSASDTDALATAVAVLGYSRSVELLKKSHDFKAVLLRKKESGFEIHYSKGLSGKIKFIDKWNDIPHVEF